MMHANYGGVTNGQWWVHIYQPLAKPDLVMGLQAQRDARTVSDCMADNGRPCKPPPELTLTDTPSTVMVRPGTYHCAGLLPWEGTAPWVITTNIYSKTKYCCRTLTMNERLFSRDVTKSMLEHLTASQLKGLLADEKFLPDKCCTAILDSVLAQAQLYTPLAPKTDPLPLISRNLATRLFDEQELKQMQAATKADDAI